MYERVETGDFIMHRVTDDKTREIKQLGFELDGHILSYKEFIAHQPKTRPVSHDALLDTHTPAPSRSRIWALVALSSTVTGTTFAVVSHLIGR